MWRICSTSAASVTLCENTDLRARAPKLVQHREAPGHHPWMYLHDTPAPGQVVSNGMAPGTRHQFQVFKMQTLAAACPQMSWQKNDLAFQVGKRPLELHLRKGGTP